MTQPAVAWGAVLIVLALYVATMGRGIGFYDSGELAVAAVELGLAHPPGQPLYTMLGWVFAHLPGIEPLVGLNLLSAVSGALTVLPAFSLAEHMVPDEARDSRGGAVATALTLVVISQHAALWEQSTRIELYALTALLGLWSLARLAYVLERGASGEGWLALGAALGACAAVNPVMAAFAALCGAPPVLAGLFRKQVPWAGFGWLVAGLFLGLVPYVYVPLIAEKTDRLVWGAPTHGTALIHYLTVRDFRVNVGVPVDRWFAQTLDWLHFASDSGLLPVWIIGLTGHMVAPPGRLTRLCAPIATATAVLYLSNYAIFRPDVPDCVSYASLSTWLCAVGASALTGVLWQRGSRVGAVGLGLAATAASVLAPPFVFSRTRHVGDPARELATTLLDSLPEHTVLIADSDHWIAPIWYLQEIEGVRPDVVVIATGLLSSSWYFDHLYRRHPTLVRTPLQGPGGQIGRLSRMLEAHPDRPVAFESEGLARALGLETCPGPVFAHARVACSSLPEHRDAFANTLSAMAARTDAGEPAVTGALATISLARARMLAAHGQMQDALRALFAGIDPVLATLDTRLVDKLATVRPGPLYIPRWRRQPALGDPAQNLFVAADLARRAGDLEHAIVWLMLARDLGLHEAEEALRQMEQAASGP